jgi:sugar-specific transcriptional regulator TrmB
MPNNNKVTLMQPALPERTAQVFSYCESGGISSEKLGVLADLGLTSRQARVYLTLLRFGVARARPLAVAAGVPRQEVYSLLLGLRRLGLVRQNLTAPASYTAVPIAEGVRLLVEKKTSELNLMSKKAGKLAETLSQTQQLIPQADTLKSSFGKVFEGDQGKKYRHAIQKTQHSLQAVTGWLRFRQFCFLFEAQLKSALKKDITIQIAAEKPPNYHLPEWVNTALHKHPNFELKTTPNPPAASITLFDGTQAAVAFNPNSPLTKGPDLWTTRPGLITACQSCFNTNWTAAAKTQPKQQPL